MKTLLEYKNSCRICLRSDAGPTNVYHYSIAGYQKPLAQVIFTLFKIKVVFRRVQLNEAKQQNPVLLTVAKTLCLSFTFV